MKDVVDEAFRKLTQIIANYVEPSTFLCDNIRDACMQTEKIVFEKKYFSKTFIREMTRGTEYHLRSMSNIWFSSSSVNLKPAVYASIKILIKRIVLNKVSFPVAVKLLYTSN